MSIIFDGQVLTPAGWREPSAEINCVAVTDDNNQLAWRYSPGIEQIEKAELVSVHHRTWYNFLDYRVGPDTFIPVLVKKPVGTLRRVQAAELRKLSPEKRGASIRWYHLFGVKGAEQHIDRPDVLAWYAAMGATYGGHEQTVAKRRYDKYEHYLSKVADPGRIQRLQTLMPVTVPTHFKIKMPEMPDDRFMISSYDAARIIELATRSEMTVHNTYSKPLGGVRNVKPVKSKYLSYDPDLLQLAFIIFGLGSTVNDSTEVCSVIGRAGSIVATAAKVKTLHKTAWRIDQDRPLLRRNGRVLIL